MNEDILPCPEDQPPAGTPTEITTNPPSPIEIEHALSVLGAEQVAPGVWLAELSIGVKIRITDPATSDGLARRLAEREAARFALHVRHAERIYGGAPDER